ncbi:ORF6C domain-containing protein [Bacillus infantis]|uniref:ORF6C domain-containing protein n=1 Tax=Bacillus infantis TaxID=324767 RepID=UPI0020A0B2CE|nr:ORF6C domain-containing protein [Bacillus infantis]MCP1159409.1 ORF6C domain-containing protein [Bacillus infantis]
MNEIIVREKLLGKIKEVSERHENEIANVIIEYLENDYKQNMIEYIQDAVTKSNRELSNKVDRLEEKERKQDEDIEQIKDVTFVLNTEPGKRKSFTKLINSLCYKKYTGKKHTIKDKLFHMAIVRDCYSRVYDQFEVNSYHSIKLEDYEEAIKVVNRWYNNPDNIKRVVNKRLGEYVKDRYLPVHKQEMVEKFLDMTNGGVNL